MTGDRTCVWCKGPIPTRARRDSICCSVRCRQARHRFTTGVGRPAAVADGRPLRLAYADPPYIGKARRYYGDHPDYAGEVDHVQLLADLVGFDGWALSCSAISLPQILPLCPSGVRVAAWHRGERAVHSWGPLNGWEPVIFWGGRAVDALPAGRDASPSTPATGSGGPARRVDSLVYRPGVRATDPARVIGSKPAVFIRWIFDLLGALPGDEMVDLFPGSGGVDRAWQTYTQAGA